MEMALSFDTEIGLSILPVQSSSNSTFAALTSIHYVQMPKEKISEAHSMAKIIYHHRIQSGFRTAQKYALTYIRITYIFTKVDTLDLGLALSGRFYPASGKVCSTIRIRL